MTSPDAMSAFTVFCACRFVWFSLCGGVSMSVRKIPRSYTTVQGKIYFRPRGWSLCFKSPLERDFFILQFFDETVDELESNLSLSSGKTKKASSVGMYRMSASPTPMARQACSRSNRSVFSKSKPKNWQKSLLPLKTRLRNAIGNFLSSPKTISAQNS